MYVKPINKILQKQTETEELGLKRFLSFSGGFGFLKVPWKNKASQSTPPTSRPYATKQAANTNAECLVPPFIIFSPVTLSSLPNVKSNSTLLERPHGLTPFKKSDIQLC